MSELDVDPEAAQQTLFQAFAEDSLGVDKLPRGCVGRSKIRVLRCRRGQGSVFTE